MASANTMFDWDELNNSLESKFKKYNEKFNSDKVDEEHMTFASWKNFTGNISFGHIYRCDIYEVLHDCGDGPEGHETLQFGPFKKALEKLFDRERSRQDANYSSELSEKVLLSEVINKPVTVFSAFRCLKFLLAATSENEPDITKYASELGSTLKVMAKTSIVELTDIGVGTTWIGPAVVLLKKIWELLEAYRDIPDVLKHFAAMLAYLTDALVFIERNNIYNVEVTKRRLNGLKEILVASELLFEKATKKSTKKVRKFFAAKKYIDRLKDQENKIGYWMQSVYLMQLAENQQQNKEMHSDIKEVLTVVAQTKVDVKDLGEIFFRFLYGIYRRGCDEDGFKKTVEEIFRRYDISPPDEGVSVPGRSLPSQVQENHGPPGSGIQASNQGDPGPAQAEDLGAGGPVSYIIQSEAIPWSREEASMQMTPDGPTLQKPRPKRQQDSLSPRTSQTPQPGPSDSDSPSVTRRPNFTDTVPHSDGEIEPVVPSAPPESLPPDQNQGDTPTSENHTSPQAHSAGTPAVSTAPPVERFPPERPPPNNQSPTELILKEGEDISDVLLWVSDHFGNSGFINFARSLPGPKRLNTTDIQAAEYELDRHHALSERNMAILEYWHQRNPDQCTVNTMYQMLRKIGKNEMAKNLKERWCRSISGTRRPRPPGNTASGGRSHDVTNHTDRLNNSSSNTATVSPSPRPTFATASGGPSHENTNHAIPIDNSTSGAGAIGEEYDMEFVDGLVVNNREYDFLILHEDEDEKDVDSLRQNIMKHLKGAEVAILADFHTEGTRPRPLKAGLEKTTLVAFYISINTATKNRESSIIANLNFELVNESKKEAFIIYKSDGAEVKDLLKNDTLYLKALAVAAMTYDVTARNFMKKMNDWFLNHKQQTVERRKKCLPP